MLFGRHQFTSASHANGRRCRGLLFFWYQLASRSLLKRTKGVKKVLEGILRKVTRSTLVCYTFGPSSRRASRCRCIWDGCRAASADDPATLPSSLEPVGAETTSGGKTEENTGNMMAKHRAYHENNTRDSLTPASGEPTTRNANAT